MALPPHSGPHGRRVKCPGGFWAYVPAPLPPPIRWSESLIGSLSRADRAIGRLAGEGRSLPNPHLLIRPFVRREAVLSSRIEGTQATLGELLAHEAGAAVDRSPDDLREVGNYVVALEHGVRRLSKLPLSLRLVREIHEKLMRGVRGGHATPGEFRKSQNWIGPRGSTPATASYVPPPPLELAESLAEWERYLHDETLPPLVHLALTHSQFEAIHPFLDGNGRVGRLLITLMLVQRGVLPTPLLYLSAFFEANRADYYDCLQGVTRSGEWEKWVAYFLAGIEEQSVDATRRLERIEHLGAEWRRKLGDVAMKFSAGSIDALTENPYCTVNMLMKRLGVAFTTAQRVMQRLETAGIVAEVSGAKRNRVYCARELLEILEAPSIPAKAGRRRTRTAGGPSHG